MKMKFIEFGLSSIDIVKSMGIDGKRQTPFISVNLLERIENIEWLFIHFIHWIQCHRRKYRKRSSSITKAIGHIADMREPLLFFFFFFKVSRFILRFLLGFFQSNFLRCCKFKRNQKNDFVGGFSVSREMLSRQTPPTLMLSLQERKTFSSLFLSPSVSP